MQKVTWFNDLDFITFKFKTAMTELLKNSTGPVKMLDFIRHLYKRTKILNKLNEKESRDFQEELVRLLVDG